jgi:magnesium transporter
MARRKKNRGSTHGEHHRRPHFQRRTEPGAPPGTLVSDPNAPRGHVHLLAFDADHFEEAQITEGHTLSGYLQRWPVTWLNVDGLGDAALIAELGREFRLHKLALEDVLHVHQRAKAESYGDHYFLVARMPLAEQPTQTEQISFFFGERFVLTFQEHSGGDCLDAIRNRIRSGWGRGRLLRPDYLVYAILDAIVDHYFPVVESCGERLDELEETLAAERSSGVILGIHSIKRNLVAIRRVIWPLRDAVNTLLRESSPLIADETRIYLRDVHDHTVQMIDLVESYRDLSSSITEVQLARVNQRTNEIMKVLTIIATIFIPLSFIVGVYGMNFDSRASPWNMPELGWYWGYPMVWLILLGAAGGMLSYFHRRGWLRRDGGDES